MKDLQLERDETVEDVGARGQGLDCGQDGVEVRAFRCTLVEEPKTREAGESEVPELYEW